MSVTPGSTLGKFVLESQLGGGGMGSVYKARDRKLNRTVAIKVLNSQLEFDLENIERFEREAKIIAALQHPNLMHVYDVGIEDGMHYFAMEYIEGISLHDLIEDDNYELTQEEALRIIIEIMSGLQKVHSCGIIHRDIKPANIMIEKADGRAILVDFGLSKSASDSELTSAGSVLGTPDYISPEQIEGNAAGAYSDIYSLGVVFYEMLSSNNPFSRGSAIKTIRAHCDFVPTPLYKLVHGMPRKLSNIIDNMIQPDPQNRYRCIEHLAKDLLEVCEHPILTKLSESSSTVHLVPKITTEKKTSSVKIKSHKISSSLSLEVDSPLWRYLVIGLAGFIIVYFLFFNNKDESDNTVLKKIQSYDLPIVTYYPDDSLEEPEGVLNPSVVLRLNSGERVWGRILDIMYDDKIALGLFPRGSAEFPLHDVHSIIMPDSQALDGKIPQASELIRLRYPDLTHSSDNVELNDEIAF